MSSDDDDDNKRWSDFVCKYDNKIGLFQLKHLRKDVKLNADFHALIAKGLVKAVLARDEEQYHVKPLHIIQLAKEEEKTDDAPDVSRDMSGKVKSRKFSVIERPPGHRLIILLQVFLPRSTFERIYGQMIADSRAEFYEALKKRDYIEAEKIKRQLCFNMLSSVAAFVAGLPFHFLAKPLGKIFNKDE